MTLKDHYLIEDYDMLTDQLEQLYKTLSNALESATSGNFLHNDQYVKQVDQSLKVLMALNAKKLQREELETANSIRRNWF